MDLRSLRYFLAAFETGSITQAARSCRIAQPSISLAIKGLEEELGVALFERSRHGLKPRPPAFQLADRARRLLEDVNSLRSDMAASEQEKTEVSLFVHPTIIARRVRPIIRGLVERPEFEVRLTCDRDEAQAAIVPGEGASHEHELWRERYALCLPESHPLADQPDLVLDDLRGIRLIARCSCERPQTLPRERIRPVIVAEAHEEERVLALVSAGVGAAVVPNPPADYEGIVVRTLADFDLHRAIVAVGHGGLGKTLADLCAPMSIGQVQ